MRRDNIHETYKASGQKKRESWFELNDDGIDENVIVYQHFRKTSFLKEQIEQKLFKKAMLDFHGVDGARIYFPFTIKLYVK